MIYYGKIILGYCGVAGAALKTTGSGGTLIMGMIPNGTKYYGAGCVHCPVQGHHRCLVQPQQQEIAHDT